MHIAQNTSFNMVLTGSFLKDPSAEAAGRTGADIELTREALLGSFVPAWR